MRIWVLLGILLILCQDDSMVAVEGASSSPTGDKVRPRWWGQPRRRIFTDENAAASSSSPTQLSEMNETCLSSSSNSSLNPSSTAIISTENATNSTASSINNNNNTSLPRWKQSLPIELQHRSTLQRITVGGGGGSHGAIQIYLLGTAHVSNDSCADVRLLLEHIQPSVVFVELCEERVPMMLGPSMTDRNNNRTFGDNHTTDELEMLVGDLNSKKKKHRPGFWQRFQRVSQAPPQQDPGGGAAAASSRNGMSRMSAFSSTLLSSIQQDYADALGVELGGEFRAAYQYALQRQQDYYQEALRISSSSEAAAVVGQPQQPPWLILGDRPLRTTLRRAWEALNAWQKIKVVAALLYGSLFSRPDPEELRSWMDSIMNNDENDLLTESMKELQQHFPPLARVILEERDAYLACKLAQLCRYIRPPPSIATSDALSTPDPLRTIHHDRPTTTARTTTNVVAIVGAGHVNGIVEWLTNGNGQRPEDILANITKTKQATEEELHDMIHSVRQMPLDF